MSRLRNRSDSAQIAAFNAMFGIPSRPESLAISNYSAISQKFLSNCSHITAHLNTGGESWVLTNPELLL